MKKLLLPLCLTLLTAVSSRADLVWYEGFNYADGALTNQSSLVWRIHSFGTGPSGTPVGNDAYVRNHRVEVSGNSSTNAPRQSDFNRPFYTTAGGTATNGIQVVYASFTVNCTNLPTAVQNYFAHFNPTANQQARVFNAAGTLPKTWRLGITGAGTTPINVFPTDLGRDTDYQVVVGWNPTAGTVDGIPATTARLWVNPIDATSPSIDSGDGVATPVTATTYSFRQAAGTTSFFVAVSNCAVATTFSEAATNVWATNAVSPAIVFFSPSVTNFAGDNVLLSGLAAGQGLANLTYTWLKNGSPIVNPDGNTNILSLPGAVVSQSGDYRLVATTPYSLSVTSAIAKLWVTNAPVPPTITVQPVTNVLAYANGNVTFTLTATGPGPIDYTWKKGNTVVSGPNPIPDYTISPVQPTDAGTYVCLVGNVYGTVTSSNVFLVVTNPPTVSIAYLRSLVNPSQSSLFQATGTVTTYTNLTTGNTASYYLQDSTAGINIFATLGSSFRPQQGDVVTFVGFLSTFQGTLELYADTTTFPATSYTVLSNNLALLPAPRTIPFNITNNLTFTETNLEASIVMLTNVFFGTNAGTTLSTTANTSVIVTNDSGRTFSLLFPFLDAEVAGKTLPEFAYTVVGPLTQNTNNALNAGYQISVTRFSDIVTNPLTQTITHSLNQSSLTWTSAPVSYSYTIWGASDVSGPYTSLTNKLRFTDENGGYIDNSAGGSQKYYLLTTP